MKRELLRLFDVTRRAAAVASAFNNVSRCDPEVFRCIDALKELKDFPATPTVVDSIQLTRKLFPLTKHPNIKIRTAASDVVQVWNDRISAIKELEKSLSDHHQDTRETKTIVRGSLVIRLKLPRKPTAATSDAATMFPAHEKVSLISPCNNDISRLKLPRKPTTAKSEAATMFPAHKKVSLTSPGNTDISRDKVRELVKDSLDKAVAEAGGATEIDPRNLATMIESVMFKSMGSFNGPNKLKYRSILFNLKDPKNPDFRRKVLRGKVTPEAFVSMTTEEMASHQRRKENQQIRKKALSKKHIEVEYQEPQEMDP
ncbi:transcription elongation factor A protein 1 [Tripterygium wilfordii]|uniref:Transcription elongation factor A protein 1 n=1 Tax=Tripterygium wilfordii TaxID=458696 RepID=A0A7J7BYD6_TRIWF|nr:transcription elongation factor A protein 1 [Tripterygium wilfordii]